MSKKRILSMLLVICMLVTTFIPQTAAKAYAEENKETIIDVTEFGADPTGYKDSAEAIQKAIDAAAKAEGAVIINFPKGEYQIYPDKAAERELYISNTMGADVSHKMKKIGILLENMTDVTVEGNDSLFNFHGKMMTFAAIDCKNVTFQNYSVDFQVPTVVDITVEKVEGNSAIVYVPECYNYQIDGTSVIWKSDASPYTGVTYWTGRNSFNYTQVLNLKDGTSFRTGNPLFSGVASIEDLGSNRLKFNYGAINNAIQEGYSYQMRPTVRDHAGAFFWKSEGVALENLNIHFLHGFGIVGQSSTGIHLDGLKFETPEGSGRTTAGYADFIQMSGCKGEIRIENCSFENPHDDPINIHGTFMQIVERIAANKFKVKYMHSETAGFPNFFVGDEVEFMTKGNMIPVQDSVSKVTEVSGPSGDSGADQSGTGSLKDIIITLDQDMPEEIKAGTHVVENITYTPSVVIENNLFKEVPTRGILVTTRKKVEIRGNEFDSQGMAAIYISNDAQGWYESGPVRDVLIEDNVFFRSGLGTATQPVIYIDPTNPSVSADRTVHENIDIKGNTFYMKDNQVLGAKSVKDLTFRENRIYRYDPQVRVKLSAEEKTLKMGESAVLQTEASAKALSSGLYSFNGCKNVLITDNVYDGGLNLNASLANMSASELSLGEEENIVVNGSTNQTSKTGKIYYESSDEKVLKVSAAGIAQAVGAGTASVTAYSLTGGRRFDSQPLEFTVTAGETGNYPEKIKITADKEIVQTLEETVQYTAEVQPAAADGSVNWLVLDPGTQETSSHASISEEGLLTPVSNGVAEVVALTANGLEDRKLLVIQTEEKTLGAAMEIVSEAPTEWSLGENGIRIAAKRSGLWATQTVNNIFVGRGLGDLTDVTAEIKLHGKTKANYDEAGLLFYKDNDNYVALERKHAAANPKVYVVTEAKAVPNEDNPVTDGTGDDIYFKLEKKQNQVTGYCSDNGTNWREVRKVENASLGNEFGIGFIAASGSDSGTWFEFSKLMIDGEEVELLQNNTMPEASDIAVQYLEAEKSLSASYTFSDAEESAEGQTLVKWLISDEEEGSYRLLGEAFGANVKVSSEMAGCYVKAVVIPRDKSGMYGFPKVSEQAVYVAQGGSEEESGQVKSADARLEEAAFTGTEGFADFNIEDNYYLTTANADQETLEVSAKAKNKEARIELSLNRQVLVPFTEAKAEISDLQINLVSGINVIQARVQAADAQTQEVYRFVIMRKGYNLAEPQTILLAGEKMPDFLPENKEYSYTTERNVKTIAVKASGMHKSAAVSVRAGGKIYDGAEADIPLKPGSNEVVIKIKSDTSAAPNFYKINVKVPSDGNANLEAAKFGEGISLESNFAPDVKEYSGKAFTEKALVDFQAEEREARIQVKINNRSFGSATGRFKQELPMSLGVNELKVSVTSPDGKSVQAYTWKIMGADTVYLSDLNYDAGQSFAGYGPTANKDRSTDGNPLTLLDESGTTVTFERGMGTHATAVLVYNIEGMGFKKFSTYMGVDQEITQKEQADMVFRIYVDGEKVYESGTLTGSSPMTSAVVSVEGAKVLKLEADKLTYDYSDHADFADAKFITDMKPWEEGYTVSYDAAPKAGGSVSASAEGEEDSSGEIWVKEGNSVTLTARAAENYRFEGWYTSSGEKVSADLVYTVSQIKEDKQYEARFTEIIKPVQEYSISYSAAPAAGGSVTVKSGAQTGKDGRIVVKAGETAILTANAGMGYRFIGWYDEKGNKVSDLAVYTIASVKADSSCQARFTQMIPAQVTGVKNTAKTVSSIALKWNAVPGASGYEIWRASGKSSKFVKSQTAATLKFTDKKCKPGSSYSYKVRAYVNTAAGTAFGEWSPVVKACTKLKKPVLSVKKRTKNSVTFTWKGGTKADKYQIQKKTGKGSYKRIKTVSGKTRKFTANKLKKGVYYRFRIRGYKNVLGQNAYSDYSRVIKVRIK